MVIRSRTPPVSIIMIKNPYQQLQHEIMSAGAKVLLSSGQACVAYGIAAFSKDGDWVIEESDISCQAVLSVLERKGADYRRGAPLDVRWLAKGWTSHFEYMDGDIRARTDFCSRPPRINDIKRLWKDAVQKSDIGVVDAQSLIQLKLTRRSRDYIVIGALAEELGLNGNLPELALEYLQDYTPLAKAVKRWPQTAALSSREAVRLLLQDGSRDDVVNSLARERDRMMEADEKRIQRMLRASAGYQEAFSTLKRSWKQQGAKLAQQHADLCSAAVPLLGENLNG
jgi:hypothetical protein